LSDTPKRFTSQKPENNALGELRDGFDEIYGNFEGFSKRAVGSLFDDDNDVGSEKDASIPVVAPKEPRPVRKSPSRPVGSGGSFGRDADPDEDYARYIRTAEKANRMEQERQRVDKEQAIMEREEKLGDNSRTARPAPISQKPVPQQSHPKKPTLQPALKAEMRNRNTEESNMYMPMSRGRDFDQFNPRILIAIGVFVMLLICATLTWFMLSARSDLTAANERIEEQDIEINRLNMANAGLVSDISERDDYIDELYRDIQFWQTSQAILGNDAATDNEGDDEPDNIEHVAQNPTTAVAGDLPYTRLDAQGRRIYEVQSGDTLWNIAIRVYEDSSRVPDILEANNLTEAQAGNIQAGQILFIPD